MDKQQQLRSRVEAYINAYNQFDIAGMLSNLHPEVVFKDVNNGTVDLSIQGINAFKAQAEIAAQFFTERQQSVTELRILGQQIEVDIDYTAVLATDLPNGLKAGEPIQLKGKSIFWFDGDLIRAIEDHH